MGRVTSPQSRPDPAGDLAVAVFSSIETERGETVAIPGRRVDRFVARLMDGMIVNIPLYLATAAISSLHRPGANLGGESTDLRVALGPAAWNGALPEALLVFVAVLAAYEVLFTAWRGATFGKRKTQLRIVDQSRIEPAVPARILLRTIIWALPLSLAILTWFYSILFAWSAFALLTGMYCWRFREDSGGRPLWDVLAGTDVISTDFEPTVHRP